MRPNRRALAAGLLFLAAAASAQEYGAGFARFMDRSRDQVRYSAAGEPGVGGAPSVWRQQADASDTVVSRGSETWTVNARAGELDLGAAPVVIPQTGVTVPRQLWNLRGGAGYSEALGDRRRWGADLSLGSDSDRPFLAWREDSVSASAYYQLPSRERNSWVLLLNYSNNRPFLNNVPLPGVAYIVDDPADHLQAVLGFPFAFARWSPVDPWTFSGGVFGTASWFLESARRLSGPVSAYARIERQPLQWLRAGRATDTDRLVFDSKDAMLGLRSALGGGFSADAAAGRVFDRRFFEGKDANAKVDGAYASLPADWVLTGSLSYRWGHGAH